MSDDVGNKACRRWLSALARAGLPGCAVRVGVAIASEVQWGDGSRPKPLSARRLRYLTRMSEGSVARALRLLRAGQWVAVAAGEQGANVYRLTLPDHRVRDASAAPEALDLPPGRG